MTSSRTACALLCAQLAPAPDGSVLVLGSRGADPSLRLERVREGGASLVRAFAFDGVPSVRSSATYGAACGPPPRSTTAADASWWSLDPARRGIEYYPASVAVGPGWLFIATEWEGAYDFGPGAAGIADLRDVLVIGAPF
jgi:hypothetical protein